jgi:hypothetical protein
LEQDLDEDARASSGVFFGEMDSSEGRPGYATRMEQVAEELGSVAQLVDFKPVHCLVLAIE